MIKIILGLLLMGTMAMGQAVREAKDNLHNAKIDVKIAKIHRTIDEYNSKIDVYEFATENGKKLHLLSSNHDKVIGLNKQINHLNNSKIELELNKK
jgi:hypothetical protein